MARKNMLNLKKITEFMYIITSWDKAEIMKKQHFLMEK